MATVRAGISDVVSVERNRDLRLVESECIRQDDDTTSNLGTGESSGLDVGDVSTLGNDSDRDVFVGSDLREVREDLGLTQKQLAERSGYTHGWISVIERDTERPTKRFLRDMEMALGVPLGTWSREWVDRRKLGDTGDKLMTPTEVARYLNVSRGVVYSYFHRPSDGVDKNKLAVVYVDKYMRVAIADLARWICIEDERIRDAEDSGACSDSLLMLIGQEEQAIKNWLKRERS